MRVLKTKATLGLYIDEGYDYNVYLQFVPILACDILWLSGNYLMMLMLEVSLSLVYHLISVTYVQFLTIMSIICMQNCKNYLTVIRVVM